jgi:copper chaperone CopZ
MTEQKSLKLKIHGMHCDACVRRVTGSLNKLPGVQVESVQVGEAQLAYDPSQVNTQTIATAIQDVGFEADTGSLQC